MGRRRSRSAYARQLEVEQDLERKYRAARRERSSKDVPREKESRYGALHRAASTRRRRAAKAVDQQAHNHGNVLGWYATLDERTTPECAAAHGKNFRVDMPPAIGWPGTVHGKCRCKPGPPHGAGELLSTAGVQQNPSNMNVLIRRAVTGAQQVRNWIFGRSND